jgi:hypothetical protein
MSSKRINPELNVGDKVVLLHMEDKYTNMMPGTKGVVTRVEKVFGVKQYGVKWEDGSKLSLLSDVDAWKLDDGGKKLNKESFVVSKKTIIENNQELFNQHEIFMNFNMKFLHNYLKMIRDSSIVNMFGAGPYLYMGRERIENEFEYRDIPSEDEFEKVLDHADEAQQVMIAGVIKTLEKQNKEVNLENINRGLQRYAPKIVSVYTALF